jgi:hypothetical protein
VGWGRSRGARRVARTDEHILPKTAKPQDLLDVDEITRAEDVAGRQEVPKKSTAIRFAVPERKRWTLATHVAAQLVIRAGVAGKVPSTHHDVPRTGAPGAGARVLCIA